MKKLILIYDESQNSIIEIAINDFFPPRMKQKITLHKLRENIKKQSLSKSSGISTNQKSIGERLIEPQRPHSFRSCGHNSPD